MIYLDKTKGTPLYQQIYEQIKEDIISGVLTENFPLLGIRTQSKALGVARNTVERAYMQLELEGYIYPKKGTGFIVEGDNGETAYPDTRMSERSIDQEKPDHSPKYLYDFQYGGFPKERFPETAWKKQMNQVWSYNNSNHLTCYHPKQGNLSLRSALRKHLAQTRGVRCNEEQIIIGCGLHYTLEILCKLFDGSRGFAMEEPGYNGAREVFINNRYPLSYIPADSQGIDRSLLEKSDVSAVYVTPSHQFPYGSVMSIINRKELLKWAVNQSAYIIEDDYDSEYRYDVNPVPSLQSIDSDHRVIYIGTFSKSLSPSLRVNYMVLPEGLMDKYNQKFSTYNNPVSWLIQETLARFIESGEYGRHIRRMCTAYKKNHQILLNRIESYFPGKIAVYGKGAGMHCLLEFLDGSTADCRIDQAKDAGILLYSVKPFWADQANCPENMVFAGYSLFDGVQLDKALEILKNVWKF